MARVDLSDLIRLFYLPISELSSREMTSSIDSFGNIYESRPVKTQLPNRGLLSASEKNM